jgi:hypothetical protein
MYSDVDRSKIDGFWLAAEGGYQGSAGCDGMGGRGCMAVRGDAGQCARWTTHLPKSAELAKLRFCYRPAL